MLGKSLFFHWRELLWASEQSWNIWDGGVRSQETVTQAKATTDLRLNCFLCSRPDPFVQWTSCHRTFFFFLKQRNKRSNKREQRRLVPGAVVLLCDWLEPVARLMSSFFFFFASFPLCPDRDWTGFQLLTLVEHPHSVCVVRVFLQEKTKQQSQTHELSVALMHGCYTHLPANYFSLRLPLTHKKTKKNNWLWGTDSKCCGVFSSVWMSQALYLFRKKTFHQREQFPSSITPNRNIFTSFSRLVEICPPSFRRLLICWYKVKKRQMNLSHNLILLMLFKAKMPTTCWHNHVWHRKHRRWGEENTH